MVNNSTIGRYSVYRNLNNGQLSIRDSRSGLVVGHCQRVLLGEVRFKVSLKGIERIRRLKQKSVVGTVNGCIIQVKGFVGYKGRTITGGQASIPEHKLTRRVYFDPYKWDGFVDSNGNILSVTTMIEVNKSGVMYMS